jgi:predicted ATPase
MKLEDLQKIKNTDQKHLALESLGKFEDYVDVFQLRQMLINWVCPTMELDLSVGLSPMAIPRNKNEARAAFLLEQIKAMEKKHLYDFEESLPFFAKHLPDIESIHITKTESGNMLLQFKNKFFNEPFNAHEVSPGLLRLFAYSLFLEDSIPYPFIGFDSIDDNLDEKYCQALISQIYNHIDNIASTQFLTTANSPYLIDQVDPNDVWMLEQTSDGFTSVFRASDDLAMRNVNMQEMPPDTRWYTDFVNRPS